MYVPQPWCSTYARERVGDGGLHMYVPLPWCSRNVKEGRGGRGKGGGQSSLYMKVHKRGGGWGRSEEGGMEWGGPYVCPSALV